jgi:hypothetical protein
MATLTYREIPTAIQHREAFSANSLHAERIQPNGYVGHGRLDPEDAAVLEHARKDAAYFGEDLYVVYSYATPIAWGLDKRALTVPDTTYSRTTSRGQHLCRVYGQV